MTIPDEEFISEPIKPVAGTYDTGKMASGEPGFPAAFSWRGKAYHLKKIISQWRKATPCQHGSGEMYVRKHFFKIETESGDIMTLYFDRQVPRGGKAHDARWWLLSKEKTPIKSDS